MGHEYLCDLNTTYLEMYSDQLADLLFLHKNIKTKKELEIMK